MNDGNENVQLNLNNSVDENYTIYIENSNQFAQSFTFEIPKDGDVIKSILFNIKMNSAPNGYHYKKAWYNNFFKEITLDIGGKTIFLINSNMLCIEHLIRGESGSNELTFNYPTVQERIEKSRAPHEVVAEPLKISELIDTGIIRSVSLIYQVLKINFITSNLMDILEPDEVNVEPLIEGDINRFIKSIKPTILYQSLDTEARLEMFSKYHEDNIKQYVYNKFEVYTTLNNYHYMFKIHNICSGMYIHVTDKNNNEIPQQLISNICILFDGIQHKFNFDENNNQVADNEINNNKSKNLYHLSCSTRTNKGINLTNIRDYKFIINWVNNINIDVNVHFVHKTNNILKTSGGLGGVYYHQNLLQPVVIKERDNFPNTDQLINVPSDEVCMISQDSITEGTEIDYCKTCRKSFTTELLTLWMNSVVDKKCIYCAQKYNTNTFIRGRAHLI